MAIFLAETGSFTGSPNFGILESPNHARNSKNTASYSGGYSTSAYLTAETDTDSTNRQYFSIIGWDVVVYDLTSGSFTGIVPSGESAAYPTSQYSSGTINGMFQPYGLFNPGFYTWTATIHWGLPGDSGTSFTNYGLAGNFGICGCVFPSNPSTHGLTNSGTINPDTALVTNITIPSYDNSGRAGYQIASGAFSSVALLGPNIPFGMYVQITAAGNCTGGGDYTFGGNIIFDISLSSNDPAVSSPTPSSASVTHPASVTFSVEAVGSSAITYQWQVSTDGGSTWTNISAAGTPNYSGYTTDTLTIGTTATSMNGYEYQCLATDLNSTQSSGPAQLYVS